MIKVTQLELKEVLVLEYDIQRDNRGTSHKLFSRKELENIGINTEFAEEIVYCPEKKGTLYGIHFQNHPMAQIKLLCCTKGRGLDFVVDLRHDSPAYRKWVCVELSAENRKQVYIPVGFGHAFLSMEDDTHIVMRIDRAFDPALAKAVAYGDPALGITYPITNPILSERDGAAPVLSESDCNL